MAEWLDPATYPPINLPAEACNGGSHAAVPSRPTPPPPQQATALPPAPLPAHIHLTSQLSELFTALRLADMLPAAVAWCVKQVRHARVTSSGIAGRMVPRPHRCSRHHTNLHPEVLLGGHKMSRILASARQRIPLSHATPESCRTPNTRCTPILSLSPYPLHGLPIP
jgi:hypothetical protein